MALVLASGDEGRWEVNSLNHSSGGFLRCTTLWMFVGEGTDGKSDCILCTGSAHKHFEKYRSKSLQHSPHTCDRRYGFVGSVSM